MSTDRADRADRPDRPRRSLREDARKVRAIAGCALRRLFRDRSNIFFILVFPILLVLVIGVVFGGDDEPRLGVSAPSDDPLAGGIVDALTGDDGLDVHTYATAADLRSAVEHDEVQAGVVVPDGFAESLRAGDTTALDFVAGPSGIGIALQPVAEAAVRPQLVELQAARFAADQGDGDLDAALDRAADLDATVPEVTVNTRTVGDELFAEGLGRFDVGASSQLLLFVFVTGISSSVALIRARRIGVTRRMISTPTSPGVVLAGEFVGRYAVVAGQATYILIASWLIFGVDWGDPFAALLVALAFALVATGGAMLAGSLFRNEQQASGLGVMLGIGLGAIGGCMVPLQIFPSALRTVAHLTPHAWALDAFDELVRDDVGVAAILPDLGALVAMAAVLIVLAAWRLGRQATTI
jgi:ABC-2 type transport system permease protein